MTKHIKLYSLIFLASLLVFSGCKKEKYSFGELTAPSELSLTTTIAGVDTNNPNGNGTGNVSITLASQNAINYKVDFGDGQTKMVSSGTLTHRYTTPGTADYTIVVNAIGTGGSTSTISKKVKVYVAFEIPTAIVSALTGGTSKVWVTDKLAPGHFGVGPTTSFFSEWYSADPNQRSAEMYNDEITFSKDANNNIFMQVDNKGKSFITGFATAFYGLSGADNDYTLNTGGLKKLVFMDATSASTSSVSTRIQFVVPGNGIVNAGVGSNTYEILSITATNIHLRTIGVDGLAWYQKLKIK